MNQDSLDGNMQEYVRRHLRFGWWSLLCFIILGIVLEAFHGFKVQWYMNVANETRRLLWTLAHAHGVLLALINIAFALTLHAISDRHARWRRLGSPCLIAAGALLPMGFFLGGLYFFEGDAGVGIILVPIGGLLLSVGVALTAYGMTSRQRTE